MSATVADSFRPPWAITCWVDDNWVFTELPCKSGPPYVTRHALTEGGLSAALTLMRDLHRHKDEPFITKAHPLLRKVGPATTLDQRSTARSVLRRLKII